MAKTAIFMADGVEEIEALTVVDLLRRAGEEIEMVNIHDRDEVEGSHRITIKTDHRISMFSEEEYRAVVLPGGMPGTTHLKENGTVVNAVRNMCAEGKLVAAICAAPTVLARAGILEGKKAICYPGLEDQLTGAIVTTREVVTDGNVITSRGMGTAIPFGLALVGYLQNEEKAADLKIKIVYGQ